MIIKTKALVIKEYMIGESDKYITLLTKEHGRLQALAPKAKKADRGFASATQLFVYGDFILTSFNDTYRLMNADIIEMFHSIREDLEALSYGSYFMEFLHAVTEPMLSQPELLRLAITALKALTHKDADMPLIRRIFELRALKELGFMPQLLVCTDCGELLEESEEEKYYFSTEAGGLVCKACKTDYRDLQVISYGARYTMQYIMTSPMNKLFHFKVTSQIQRELSSVCESYIPFYIDKSFKTLTFLESLNQLQYK